MGRSTGWMSGIAALSLVAACAGSAPGGGDGAGTPTPAGSATPTPAGSPSPTPEPLVCRADEALFDEPWIDGDGGDCATEPEIQAQRVDPDTWVLRQSLCTSFEGPFLYLLFGEEKVLLEDTGDGGVDVRGAVEAVVATWLAENGRTSIERVVVNSHGHGDHTAGNGAFAGQPDTTVVGTTVPAIQDFFGIASWPEETASYDLGGRVVDVIPIPGHHPSHIAIYDHGTGWLLTGDTLYPGRLYVQDFDTYVESIQRLVDVTDGRTVCQVMGTHIEMTTTPGEDFAFGADYHPGEHPLPLSRQHLLELREAVVAMQGSPQQEAHDDFIIVP